MHAKAEGSLSALDAQLVRRAEAGLELATSGSLDPASALLVADAATTALERHTTHPLGDDPLDGQHFGGLESVESDLTAALMAALTTESVATIREDQPESAGVEARLLDARPLTHAEVNDAVGDPDDDLVTPALAEFLLDC